MIEMISKGGPLMWLLLACSILVLGIFAERLFLFHRSSINVGEFLQGLANLIQKRNYAEALHECAGTPGPVARVIHSAVIRHEAKRSELKDIVQESGQLEVPKLERYLSVMMTIVYIAPLIGLLGTVIGLVDTFVVFNAMSGQATIANLSKGVYQSLITSAAGLAVAIPAFILYSYLRTYAKTLMHDMERGGIEIVNIIEDARNNSEIISFSSSQAVNEGPVEGKAMDRGDRSEVR
ncbi:MAG: MotA/TolQ/ExbB proton channel family protein [Verrucomicrobiales bacterium]|nr:MotA/TolQ/ExbB proton channel family protein [Verrucomicrobiales bacterium]MED5585820.1 MotA/TolQ/ExbB proton channel family protein [Verrucomicrobiota bacterium]